MAFPILKIVNAAKLTCVDIVSKLFFLLMTLKTLFVMINEIPDPRLMRNILLINCLILLFNPLFLSLNRKSVHITFSIIITVSLNIRTNPQIHTFLMECYVITFLFYIFLARV